MKTRHVLISVLVLVLAAACSSNDETTGLPLLEPKEVIDLGALVTEDLPERVFGKKFLEVYGFERPNLFEVVDWEFKKEEGSVFGQNSYYTLFNHGGPHVDAPNHVSLEGTMDDYPVESFMGPLKVFDVREYPKGRSIPQEIFDGLVQEGDVVLIYTGYTPPQTDEAFPEVTTLTPTAAGFLASLPIRAFGTDAFSVGAGDTTRVQSDIVTERVFPIHHAFLSRGIPAFEQLFSVDKLLGKTNMYFVGVPLNIRGGDGMLVRPVVLVY